MTCLELAARCTWVVALAAMTSSSLAATVDLEVVMAPGFPAIESHTWLETLKGVGLDGVRMRAGRDGDQPQLRTVGDSHRVVGVINAKGELKLPAGTFRVTDRAGLAAWVEKLKAGGEAGLTAKPGAFGLTPAELVGVHEALATPVDFATTGLKTGELVDRVGQRQKLEIELDAAARRLLAGDDAVADELQGLSCGTALAAAVRPLGLVVAPQKTAAGVVLLIADVRAMPESWPVGWPTKKSPREAVPALFNFLEVEIKNVALGETLSAVQERLKTPFVYDYNSLARQQIELAKTKVTLPSEKMYYQKVLDRALFPARLKAELRVDEAEQPFFWITTLK